MRYLLTSLLCVFTLSITAQEACPNVFDYDNDGNVAVNDFLAMLGYFGDTDADSDGVWDSEDECIDLTACNYQANPTLICVYDDVIGVCGGYCLTDNDGDGVCDWEVFVNCGDLFSHEGYDYSTVQIGEQCWFAENCRYLPIVSDLSINSTTEPHYSVYGYTGTDVTAAKATENYETYGVLYNWPAVMTAGICPSGWHIPTDEEFTGLTDFLGGESVAGGKMKDNIQWDGTNSSGWTGLPGGYRHSGGFDDIGTEGHWWSASESGYYSWRRSLYTNDAVTPSFVYRNIGFSARCVRD